MNLFIAFQPNSSFPKTYTFLVLYFRVLREKIMRKLLIF